MNLKKKKKGFTLIELMAVIAIIAILAAVLVPTVNGYITRSKKTAIINQCRIVQNAIESYNAGSDVSIVKNDSKTLEEAIRTNESQLYPLVSEKLIDTNKISNIKKATLAQIKEINDNKDGDIINRIVMNGSSFESLTPKVGE